MGEWKTYKLCEVANLSTGFPFDGHKYAKEGQRVVRGDNVTIGELRWDTDKRWNEPFARAEEFSLQEGDIVIGMDGSRVGRNRAQIKADDLPLLLAQRVACVRHNEKSLQKFLYYQIFSKNFENYIKSVHTGTSIPHVSLKQIGDFSFQVPDLSTQRRIAGILGSLDDKIELNRRINANLEAQAQALFRSWFVDIDEKLCQKKKLGDFFNVITGKKDANFSSPHGEYPFFTCSQETLRAPSYSFNGHAILLAGNGDFNIKRYIGKFEVYQRTYVLIPFESKYHTYLYLLIKYYLKEITEGYRGSVIRFITKGNIANFEFSFPKESFDDKLVILDSLYQKFDNNLSESNRLSALRDTLLPKLMAGEIAIE